MVEKRQHGGERTVTRDNKRLQRLYLNQQTATIQPEGSIVHGGGRWTSDILCFRIMITKKKKKTQF